MKKEEWPLRQTGAEAMWLRVAPFYLDAYPSKWSKLCTIFKSPCGDNGCPFVDVLQTPGSMLFPACATKLIFQKGISDVQI